MVGNSTGIIVIFVLIIWGSIDQSWIFTNLTWQIAATCVLIGGGGFAVRLWRVARPGLQYSRCADHLSRDRHSEWTSCHHHRRRRVAGMRAGTGFLAVRAETGAAFPVHLLDLHRGSIGHRHDAGVHEASRGAAANHSGQKSKVVGGDDSNGGAPRQGAWSHLQTITRLLPELPGGGTYDPTGKVETRKMTTLYDTFQRGVRLNGDAPCLGTRQETGMYSWITYKEMDGLVQSFGAGLSSYVEWNLGNTWVSCPATALSGLSRWWPHTTTTSSLCRSMILLERRP